MTNNRSENNLKSDINYIKNMVEKGNNSQLKFRRFLVFAVVYFIVFAIFDLSLMNYIAKIGSTLPPGWLLEADGLRIIMRYFTPAFAIIFVAIALIKQKYFFGSKNFTHSDEIIINTWLGILMMVISQYLTSQCYVQNNDNMQIMLQAISFSDDKSIRLLSTLSVFGTMVMVCGVFSLGALGWWVTASVINYKSLKILSIIGFIAAPVIAANLYRIEAKIINPISMLIIYIIIPALLLSFNSQKTLTNQSLKQK